MALRWREADKRVRCPLRDMWLLARPRSSSTSASVVGMITQYTLSVSAAPKPIKYFAPPKARALSTL